MDLNLSLRGDYAVRGALSLARAWDDGKPRKIREIAEEMDLPRSYTPTILGLLAKAGLATARAGRSGGYRLARPPETISVLEVVEAGDGPLVVDRCTLRGGPCHWENVCALHPVWSKATEALRDALRFTTLRQLADTDRALEAVTLPTPADAHRLAGRHAARPGAKGSSNR